MAYQIIVCGGLAPDPLQTLEPVTTPTGPSLKNELMLPNVFDPWAGHALYEAANLAKNQPGSTIKVVSLGPKAKLQQVMMTVAQKLPFELIALDGPGGGFTDAVSVSKALADAIAAIPGFDKSQALIFGGWESATAAPASSCRWWASASASPNVPCRRRTHRGIRWRPRHQGARRRRQAPDLEMRRRPPSSPGPPAACPSRPTIRKPAWPTCAS